MASLTINCNTMDPLPLRSRLLGVSLFILHQPAPSWKCLRSSLCHWRHFHLHKAAHKLKALSGKKKKIPAHSRKIQQLNLDKGWGGVVLWPPFLFLSQEQGMTLGWHSTKIWRKQMKDAGRKGDLIWLNYEVQEFTNSFMYITHLTLISVQEGKFRKHLYGPRLPSWGQSQVHLILKMWITV